MEPGQNDEQKPADEPTETEEEKPGTEGGGDGKEKKEEAPQKSAREIQLEKDLEAERTRAAEASKAARKKGDSLRNEREAAGNYKGLYEESAAELTTVTTERDTLKVKADSTATELATLKKERDDFRTSIMAQFKKEDHDLVKDLPLSNLPGMYKRLYGADLFPTVEATESHGSKKPAGGIVPVDLTKMSPMEQIKAGLANFGKK